MMVGRSPIGVKFGEDVDVLKPNFGWAEISLVVLDDGLRAGP